MGKSLLHCFHSNLNFRPVLFGFLTYSNSLWPSDSLWGHWSGSTLAQVMACCLMAPNHYLIQCWLIKSPLYTGGDFMFLYRFVRRRCCRRRPQILVHAITFEQLSWFLSYLAQLLALTYRLHDSIWLIFVVILTLNFQGQIWNLLYLNQKWCDCHETKIKHIDWTLGLKYDHRVWLWSWLWPWIFQGQI